MKNNPVLEADHGFDVWMNKDMDTLRKTECLCLNCTLMMECDSAKKLHRLCCENGLALAVTRCPDWDPKE